MNTSNDDMLTTLKTNNGFDDPDIWLDYAKNNQFKIIKSDLLKCCPDCGSNKYTKLGQYIHYSTLIKLQKCTDCKLIYSNTRVDLEVIKGHFETAYKNESYFQNKRIKIFNQIAKFAIKHVESNGSILDIGGATGHQLKLIKDTRPDIRCCVNDISTDACEIAKEKGLDSFAGGLDALSSCQDKFDLIILSDVIYYEPDIKKLWEVLPGLLKENSMILIRVPNKRLLITLWQKLCYLFKGHNPKQDKVRFFNPEHLYIFSNEYIGDKLKTAGFTDINYHPTPLLNKSYIGILNSIFFAISKTIAYISFQKIILTPAIIITGKYTK